MDAANSSWQAGKLQGSLEVLDGLLSPRFTQDCLTLLKKIEAEATKEEKEPEEFARPGIYTRRLD